MTRFEKICDRQSCPDVLEHFHNLKIANGQQATEVSQNLKTVYRISRNRRALGIRVIVKQAVHLGIKFLSAVLNTGAVANMGYRGVASNKKIEPMRHQQTTIVALVLNITDPKCHQAEGQINGVVEQ